MTSTLTNRTQAPPEEKLTLNWVNVAFFTAFHGIALLAPWFFSWKALGVTIVLHWLFGSIGICLGYHRLLTHRSLQVPKWLEYVLATLGALAIQGGPIFWVSGHRQHHLYTEDPDKDPYAASRGFWWSHMLWIMYPRRKFYIPENYRKHAPDLAKDAYYTWLDKHFLKLQIPLALVLYAMGGWSFVIYGLFLRAVLLWHSTWLINSATHMVGARPFDNKDGSRNLFWTALVTYGEGWHNHHHAYPNVAPAGWKWWQIDVTWWAIRVLEVLGLARRVNRPPAEALARL
ncbi:fatty acid desaturase [Pseudanabaena sp. FACHB-2040]|uniref:acyl-CoA desaturase n=1 Tax=Pseudanabaena sp. FACHB-2040 TaxID=2692859 RepID=UPI001683A404|nr:fatty acid desaturase [Pseudanabaena sp. FACHB-2040]MBD2260925.1 fatty acid desaturase [Pseudanabaena sp. FACHB-2040]